MKYSNELKDSIIKRMLPPGNESISKISREEGIPEGTLRNWRNEARANGTAAPGNDASAEKWSTEDKLPLVGQSHGREEFA